MRSRLGFAYATRTQPKSQFRWRSLPEVIGRVGTTLNNSDLSKYHAFGAILFQRGCAYGRLRQRQRFFKGRVIIAKLSCRKTFFVLTIAKRVNRSPSLPDSGCIRAPEARLMRGKIDCPEDYKKNINSGDILIY